MSLTDNLCNKVSLMTNICNSVTRSGATTLQIRLDQIRLLYSTLHYSTRVQTQHCGGGGVVFSDYQIRLDQFILDYSTLLDSTLLYSGLHTVWWWWCGGGGVMWYFQIIIPPQSKLDQIRLWQLQITLLTLLCFLQKM